jgi:sugar lactone lactonase YvrE
MNKISHHIIIMLVAVTGLFCACGLQAVTPELAFKAGATTGEGAIWHPERKTLFWVDIEGKTLYEFIPEKGDCRTWTFDRMVSTVVPETEHTVIVALQDEIVRLDLRDGKRSSVAMIDDGGGTLRCNDGKCDPEGRLWIGTMTLQAPRGSAALYTVESDGKVAKRLDGITVSNGIVWTADKRYMYYNDTATGQIVRYAYDAATGDIRYDGVAVTLEKGTGGADGMTIDKEGNLWVAQWGGYGVYHYDPRTGKLLTKIDVPAPNVASCAFGGENLDILYITTARAGLPEDKLKAYPLSGSLFRCRPGVSGVKADYFKK